MVGNLSALAKAVGADWKESRYYAASEKDIGVFWSEGSIFKKLFEKLILGDVIDLACGHGKQSQFIYDKCKRLYLVDINEENIEVCRKRYAHAGNICYLTTNGFDLRLIESGTIDAIFCYDAMVHFAPEIVDAYLKETGRVLKKGGRGLFHHSNLANPPSLAYGNNPHARNKMSQELFAELATAAGLTVINSQTFSWGTIENLDCLSLVEL